MRIHPVIQREKQEICQGQSTLVYSPSFTEELWPALSVASTHSSTVSPPVNPDPDIEIVPS